MQTDNSRQEVSKLLSEADALVENATQYAARGRMREARQCWKLARQKRQRADKLLAAMKH